MKHALSHLKHFYDIRELAETNRQIREVLKDTTTEFIWMDPQKMLGEDNAITNTSSNISDKASMSPSGL